MWVPANTRRKVLSSSRPAYVADDGDVEAVRRWGQRPGRWPSRHRSSGCSPPLRGRRRSPRPVRHRRSAAAAQGAAEAVRATSQRCTERQRAARGEAGSHDRSPSPRTQRSRRWRPIPRRSGSGRRASPVPTPTAGSSLSPNARAKSLPDPMATTPSTVSVPASALTARWTSPSPPAITTRDAVPARRGEQVRGLPCGVRQMQGYLAAAQGEPGAQFVRAGAGTAVRRSGVHDQGNGLHRSRTVPAVARPTAYLAPGGDRVRTDPTRAHGSKGGTVAVTAAGTGAPAVRAATTSTPPRGGSWCSPRRCAPSPSSA